MASQLVTSTVAQARRLCLLPFVFSFHLFHVPFTHHSAKTARRVASFTTLRFLLAVSRCTGVSIYIRLDLTRFRLSDFSGCGFCCCCCFVGTVGVFMQTSHRLGSLHTQRKGAAMYTVQQSCCIPPVKWAGDVA